MSHPQTNFREQHHAGLMLVFLAKAPSLLFVSNVDLESYPNPAVKSSYIYPLLLSERATENEQHCMPNTETKVFLPDVPD